MFNLITKQAWFYQTDNSCLSEGKNEEGILDLIIHADLYEIDIFKQNLFKKILYRDKNIYQYKKFRSIISCVCRTPHMSKIIVS